MLHPFLILPFVGALSLGSAVLHTPNNRPEVKIACAILMLITVFGILYYMFNDVKPPRPARKNMDFWGAHIRDFVDGGGIRNLVDIGMRRPPRQPNVDRARMFVDVIDLGAGFDDRIVLNFNDNRQTDVHNHQIQESLRKSITLLEKWYKGTPKEERINTEDTFKSIKGYIFGDYQDTLDTKEKAYSTIRHIQKTNGSLASVALTEGEILALVWQRINDPVNKDVQDELRNSLIDQLADSSLRIDASVCLVGRITRMVQTLQSLDKEGLVNIKSTEIISNEIQSKIPILRDVFFADHPALLEPYEKGENNLITQQLIEFVQGKLYSDYPQIEGDVKIKKIVDEHLKELD
jgi:hypothetical protein